MSAQKNHLETLSAIRELNKNFEEKIKLLNEQNSQLMIEISKLQNVQVNKPEKEVTEIDLLKTEIKELEDNSRMKPDNKAKKLEKLQKKLEKLETKLEKPKKAENNEKKLNLSKMSSSLTNELKTLLNDKFIEGGKGVVKNTTSVEMFKSYVNSMDSQKFLACNVSDHMEQFKLTLQSNESKVVHGGALKVLTLDELAKLQNELVHTDQIGEYKTKDDMLVTGPQRNEDQEDLETKEFDGEEFDVDINTQRVYDIDTGDFKGYWRVNGGLI